MGQPRPRSHRPAAGGSGWIYPETGIPAQNFDAEFERLYRQRRQAEIRRQKQRQEAARQEALRQKKLRRRKRLAQVKGILGRFAVVFLLVCIAASGVYFSLFYTNVRERANAVTYTLGAKGETQDVFEATAATAYYNSTLYVDFTRLAAFLDLPMTGSILHMRFIVPVEAGGDSTGTGWEEFVLFDAGSFTANVNGANVDMDGPCRLIGTALWVPLSFVERYMGGVTVERGGSDAVALSRTPVGEDASADQTELLTFRIKPQIPIDPISYDSISTP